MNSSAVIIYVALIMTSLTIGYDDATVEQFVNENELHDPADDLESTETGFIEGFSNDVPKSAKVRSAAPLPESSKKQTITTATSIKNIKRGLLCAHRKMCRYSFSTSTVSRDHAKSDHRLTKKHSGKMNFGVLISPSQILSSKHVVWTAHFHTVSAQHRKSQMKQSRMLKEHPVHVVQDPSTGLITKFVMHKADNKNPDIRNFKVGAINALNHVRGHKAGLSNFEHEESFPSGSRAHVKVKVSSSGVVHSHHEGLPDRKEYYGHGHKSVRQHSSARVQFTRAGAPSKISIAAHTIIGNTAASKHVTIDPHMEMIADADVTSDSTRPKRIKTHSKVNLEVRLLQTKAVTVPKSKMNHASYLAHATSKNGFVATELVQQLPKGGGLHLPELKAVSPGKIADSIFTLVQKPAKDSWEQAKRLLSNKMVQNAVVHKLLSNPILPRPAIQKTIAAIGASGLDEATAENLSKLMSGKVSQFLQRQATFALLQPHCNDHAAVARALRRHAKRNSMSDTLAKTQLMQIQHALLRQYVHCGGDIDKEAVFAQLIDESHKKLAKFVRKGDRQKVVDLLTALGNSQAHVHVPHIESLLQAEDSMGVHRYAVETLGRVGGKAAEQILMKLRGVHPRTEAISKAASAALALIATKSKGSTVKAALEYKKAWPLPNNGDIRCDLVAGAKVGATTTSDGKGNQAPKIEGYGAIEAVAWQFTMQIIKIGVEKEAKKPITAFIEVLGFRVKQWPQGSGTSGPELPRLPGNPLSATTFTTQPDQQGYCEMDIDQLEVKGAIEYSKEFLKAERSFWCGPVPLTATIMVTGALGLKFGFGDISEQHSKKKCKVGQLLALVPYAKAELTAMAGVDLLLAQGGMGIDVTIVQISFPITNEWDVPHNGRNDPGRNCKGVNCKVESLGGKVYAWAKTIKGVSCKSWAFWKDCGRDWHEYKFTFYDWASPAEWKSNNMQCSGTGGTKVTSSGGTLTNNGVEYDYPTNYIGSWKDGGSRAFAHGPKQYGYDAASCRRACKSYKWIALQNGGWCSCSNDWNSVVKYGTMKRCWPNGDAWCNAVYGVAPDDLFEKYRTLTSGTCGFPADSTTDCSSAATDMKYIGWMGNKYWFNNHDIKVVYNLNLNECIDQCRITPGCRAMTRLANIDDGAKSTCYLRNALFRPGHSSVQTSNVNLNTGWQVYGVELPTDDKQPNGVSYDPKFCYWENEQLKFNQGRNTGSCSSWDRCLCINHCTEFYFGQKKNPGTAYASTEGVYVEEPLHSVNGYNIWVNAKKDRFMFKCPGGNTWAVTSMSNYLEAIVRDQGAGCGGFTHCKNCGGITPHAAHWGNAGFEVAPLCGNSQFNLLQTGDSSSHHCAGTYEIDLTPGNARDGVPIWQNKAKHRFAFYCARHDSWIITATGYLSLIIKDNNNCGGYMSASAHKNLNPKHLNWGTGWYTKMQ